MELIERPNLRAVHYLNSILFDKYRNEWITRANIDGTNIPSNEDVLQSFNVLKSYCKSAIKTKGITKRIYSYSENTSAGLGGRLFSGGSLQSIWNIYRGLLVRGIATDVDMQSCHPKILAYICKRHGIACPELDKYNSNRELYWKDFKTKQQGKQMYLIATNSDTSIKMKSKPAHFKAYEAEMKKIQFELINISDYKELIESVPKEKIDNFNGSAINRILCYYENNILQNVIHFINSKNIEILALMFDGLMIYGDYYDNKELLEQIEKYIDEKFPKLNMKFSYKQHDTSISIPDDFDENNYSVTGTSRFANDDETAAQILFEELKPIFVSDSKGRLYFKHNNIWITNSIQLENHVMHHILHSNICKKSEQNKFFPYSSNISSADKIYRALILKIKVENTKDIYELFHSTTKGKLCFKDGVLDFINKTFTKWDELNYEIYSSICIDYEYEKYYKNPNLDIIKEIKTKIFDNMFGDKTDIALHFIGRAIAGFCEDKNWASYLGSRDCGKGVIYEILKSTFQDYVDTFELGNLLYQRNTDTEEVSRKLYWLLDLEFVRLAVSQETPTKESGLKLSGSKIKKLAGGKDTHIARRNQEKQNTHFNIDSTFMIFGNDDLILDSNDANEHRVQFSSCNQFKSEDEIKAIEDDMIQCGGNENDIELLKRKYKVKDSNIKDKCHLQEWKLAMVYLIYDNYKNNAVNIDFHSDNCELDSLRKDILLKYNITNKTTDIIPINDIYDSLGGDKKKIDAEMKDLHVEKKKPTSGEYKNKTSFIGIVMKESYSNSIKNM